MVRDDGSRKTLIGLVVFLVLALIVVLVLWQQDEASKDVQLDVDMGGADTLVERGARLAGCSWLRDVEGSSALGWGAATLGVLEAHTS